MWIVCSYSQGTKRFFTFVMADPALIPATQAPDGKLSNLDNPSSVGYRITITNVVCIVVFMVVVIIRLVTRLFLNRSFGHDDTLIIFATLAFLAVMGVFQWMVSLGLGKHLWDVSMADYSPGFLRAWVTAAVLYSVVMFTMKLSVLMLYRRLFPIQIFRIQWWVVMCFITAYSVTFIFASIFSCSPVAATWDTSIINSRCINLTGLYISYTVMNSISTWWILLLPMPIVWSLALKNNQKTLLSVMFALGCLPCVTSIARLKVLVDWLRGGHSDRDITWTLWPIIFWTQLELTVCMICACGPTLRTFIDRQLQTIRSITTNKSWSRSLSKSWTKSWSTGSRSESHGTVIHNHKPRQPSQSSNHSNLIEMLQGQTAKSKTLVTGNDVQDDGASMEHIMGDTDYSKPSHEGIMVHTSYQVKTVNESV